MLLKLHLTVVYYIQIVRLVKDGAEGIRTPDLRLAKAAFSQLNYGPRRISDCRFRISDFCSTEPFDQSTIVNLKSAIPSGPLWTRTTDLPLIRGML